MSVPRRVTRHRLALLRASADAGADPHAGARWQSLRERADKASARSGRAALPEVAG